MRLADVPVTVRLKLSALWASVMFCYVYGDFFGLFKPGKLASMLSGETPVGPTTQATLLAFALVMVVPSSMVFLSLVIPPRVARWANVFCGALYTAIILVSMRGAWGFYIFLGIVEVVLTGAVVWYAYRWPREA